MGGWAWGISGAIVALIAGTWLARGFLAMPGGCPRSGAVDWPPLGEGRPVRPTLIRLAPGTVGRLATKTFDAVVPERPGAAPAVSPRRRAKLPGRPERDGRGRDRDRLPASTPVRQQERGLPLRARPPGRRPAGPRADPQPAVPGGGRPRLLAGPDTYRGEIILPSREVMPRSIPRVLAVHGSMLPGSSPSGAVLVFHDVTELLKARTDAARLRRQRLARADDASWPRSRRTPRPCSTGSCTTRTSTSGSSTPDRGAGRPAQLSLILDLLSLARLDVGARGLPARTSLPSRRWSRSASRLTEAGPRPRNSRPEGTRPRVGRRVDPGRRRRGSGPPDPRQPDRQRRSSTHSRRRLGSGSPASFRDDAVPSSRSL